MKIEIMRFPQTDKQLNQALCTGSINLEQSLIMNFPGRANWGAFSSSLLSSCGSHDANKYLQTCLQGKHFEV